MDPEDLRAVLRTTGVDLFTLIETAIGVAAAECGLELKARRDGIVERLYTLADGRCRNCDGDEAAAVAAAARTKARSSPEGKGWRPHRTLKGKEEEGDEHGDVDVEEDRDCSAIDDEQSKILAIKDFLDDPDQSEDYIISLLQNLADMDITFKALKETDVGRHVNSLRKHSSLEVKRLVKQLVKKWKETVDEWVKLNSASDSSSPAIITDGDSPPQVPVKNNSNGHHTPDSAHSPNHHAPNGSSNPDRNGVEPVEPKARSAARRDTPPKPFNSTPSSAATPKAKDKDSLLDPAKLASARKRLHDNYQEAQNARKQRTIQVMDIHEIPKPKNAFFPRGKGGGFHSKH